MAETAQIFNEVISNLGFPICMVVYFIWDKTHVTTQLTEAIENNNTILTRLLEKLDSYELVEDVNHE